MTCLLIFHIVSFGSGILTLGHLDALVCVGKGVLCILSNHTPEATICSEHKGSSAHDVWVAIKIIKRKKEREREEKRK